MEVHNELYHELPDVTDQLRKYLGLTLDPFHMAIGEAWLEWAAQTLFDAPSFPGTELWGHTVRPFRRSLVTEFGWTKDDCGNFSTVISPDGRNAIAVETGNEITGLIFPNKIPKTKSAKGPQAMAKVAENCLQISQGSLFASEDDGRPLPASEAQKPMLWMFLIHQMDGNVRSEVSLPVMIGDDNRIVDWKVRIILPVWRGEDDQRVRRAVGPAAGPDAEVTISRRVG